MTELENDIKCTVDILKDDIYNIGKYNSMGNYSRLYQNTTENVREYMTYLSSNNGSALLPTASGDQVLEAILKGYSDISCFDINKLTKYYVKLKLCAIESFSKKEYIKFMYDDMLSIDMFNNIKNNLDNETRSFWEELFKSVNHKVICLCLFRNLAATNGNYKGVDFSLYCANNYTSHLKDSNYRDLQGKINDVNINFIDSNLIDLPDVIDGQYDFINLTNIYEYFNKCPFSGNDKVFSNVVDDLINNHLNEDGIIMITYLYKCCVRDLYKYRDKPLIYAKMLNFINNTEYLKKMYNNIFKNGSVTNKLSFFRKFQFLRWLDDYDLFTFDIDELGLGADYFDKDMVLVYKKYNNK